MSTFKGFSKVQLTKPQRSTFDMTHDKRMTIQSGFLYPVLCTECVPSDSWYGSSEMLVRLFALLAPIYDQISVYVHYYFVPNRLLWEGWEEFITGGRLGVGVDPVTAPVPPYTDLENAMNRGSVGEGNLGDYLGVPNLPGASGTYAGVQIDAMPFLAYELVYAEYYDTTRNFTPASGLADRFPVADGSVDTVWTDGFDLRMRGYAHDYFTSALPFTQRGEEVSIPVGLTGLVPVYVNPVNGGSTSATVTGVEQPGAVNVGWSVGLDNAIPTTPSAFWAKLDEVDPAVGIAGTINDFRAAYALQVWLERNAIGGARYTESTQAHFGVRPEDSRLQRPEYIGGGIVQVKISEVVASSWSQDGDSNVYPLGNLGGHGVGYGNSNQFKYFCTEHGFILGLVSVLTPPTYFQGLPRMFRRRSFLDYPWPTFAKLGEQEVSQFEIFANPTTLTPDAETGEFPAFGYQSRYADWKYIPNTVHSDFRSSLLFWTTARQFGSVPTLSADFIEYDQAPFDAMFAVPTNDPILLYVHNKLTVKRPLPYFGTPNTMGFA